MVLLEASQMSLRRRMLATARPLAALLFIVALATPVAAQSTRAKGAPAPTVRARDAEPKVTSQAAADLLRPPTVGAGSGDRYGQGSVDWRDVPPWRQTSFFGIRAEGQFF